MILRARIVWPVGRPAIADGAVLLSGKRIAAVGSWPEIKAHAAEPPVDLGAAILLPGLINAHCHLDYTGMTGLPALRQFPDWIKSLLALKAQASYTDYAHAWLAGAAMLARTGSTTVADIEAVPELLPEVWSGTPLRVASFLEVTGVKSRAPRGKFWGRRRRKLTAWKRRAAWPDFRPTRSIPPPRRCWRRRPGWPAGKTGG